MFDSKQCEDLKASLIPFSMGRPYDSTFSIPLSMQLYMEYYGFFDTVKALDVEYYWGVRSVEVVRKKQSSRLSIATHLWQVPSSKGCIYLVHGLFDHVGLFQKFIRYLLLQGYSVVAVDLQGHGLSEGKSTQVNSFREYADVIVDTFNYFQPLLGAGPNIAIGQSTGAAVIMSAVFAQKQAGNTTLFDQLVFLGPLLRPRASKLTRLAYYLLRRVIAQVKRDFSRPNSNDSDFHHFLQYHDPLQARALSVEWIGAMYDWVDGFDDQPQIDTPLLILQGTSDKVVDWKYNVPAIQEHFTRSQVSYIKGAMHHLVNEATPWRKVVFSGVGQFIRRPQSSY